ncbi:MAG TPA: cobalamin-binding protein [Anaerolineaceae bacterium]|nr:cobalamin-binding protein [Anaerolineaceae bacterium]
MKKSWLILLVIAILLTACTPKAPTGTTYIDGEGRSIVLAGPAQRIVSLAPSNTEILYAIGAGDQVVGRDEFSDYPAEAKDLPSVGGSMGEYDFEAIAALEPDLVLATAINTPKQVKALEELGITVYMLPNPDDLDGLYANLTTAGQLTGHEAETQVLVDSLKARVQVVLEKVAISSYLPVVFYELDGTDPAKPWTAGPDTFMSKWISLAGGRNVGDEMDSSWAQISQEALIVANPEIILLGDAAYGMTPEQVAARPGWDAIAAVESGKILVFDDNLISRPGPRLVDALETLARLLHPELFE